MADAEQVPSDLTLELGGNVSPDRFLGATRAFFGCVEEISRAVAPEGEAPTWIVRTREGSHLIGVDPAPGAKAQLVRAVYDRMKHGVEQLAAGEIELGASPRCSDQAFKKSVRVRRAAAQAVRHGEESGLRGRRLHSVEMLRRQSSRAGEPTIRITAPSKAGLRPFRTARHSRYACAMLYCGKLSIATFRRTNCRTLSPTSASASRFQG